MSRNRTSNDDVSAFLCPNVSQPEMNDISVNAQGNTTGSQALVNCIGDGGGGGVGGGSGGGGGGGVLTAELRIVLYSVIFLVSVTGNTLVILTLVQNRRMRTLTNVLLLNLSISDLLLALFCMPFTLIPTLLQNFIFGKATCVLARYMQGVSVGVSAFTLVVISMERYFAICRPLHSRRWQTVSHSYRIIGIVWTLAFLLMIPIAAYQRLVHLNNGAYKCVEIWSEKSSEMVYTVFLDVVLLVLPLGVMMTAYSLISYTLWQGTSTARAARQHDRPTLDHVDSRQNNVHVQLNYAVRRCAKERLRDEPSRTSSMIDGDRTLTSTKTTSALHLLVLGHSSSDRFVLAKKRIIRMLFVVVLEFFVCWTPTYVLQTWIVFDYAGAVARVSAVAVNLLHLLGFVSSCCHPVTYCFMNKRFRHGFVAVFRCCPFARGRGGGGGGGGGKGSGFPLRGRRRSSCGEGDGGDELRSLDPSTRRCSQTVTSSLRFGIKSSGFSARI